MCYVWMTDQVVTSKDQTQKPSRTCFLDKNNRIVNIVDMVIGKYTKGFKSRC